MNPSLLLQEAGKEVAISAAFNCLGMLSVHSLVWTFPGALAIAIYSLSRVDGVKSHKSPAAYFTIAALLNIKQTS